MQDGGEENISFMNLHFNENPRETCYGSQKLVYPLATIFHTQGFSHNMKKLRNSNLKSRAIKGMHTRKLTLHGLFIAWKQWEMAAEWGRTMTARRIHHRVTYSVTHKGEKSIKSQEISNKSPNFEIRCRYCRDTGACFNKKI